MNKLKYASYDIVFQEVPDEVSLAINITGCPHRCEGCHSDYLWNYFGSYIADDIEKLINQYENMITCVCFMGGDQNMNELKYLLHLIKTKYNLKTCVYSGMNDIQFFKYIINLIDYLKIGAFKKDLGGLSSKTTNQRFYMIKNGLAIDISNRFIK